MKFSTASFLVSLLGYTGSVVADDVEQNSPSPFAVTLASRDYTFEGSFKALIMQPFANN